MGTSYKKLWKLLIDRDLKKKDLCEMAHVSSASLTKMKNNGSIRKELWSRGLRYRKNCNGITGHPDIVFKRKKIAIFCDSEFWHGYDWENQKSNIKSNKEFWIPKIERNIQRDIEVNEILQSEGWTVIRFWGKEITKNTRECADIVEKAVRL